ncbi:MAG: hypothetical protein U9R01_03945 [candidate division WOR-3 bacterium]|nr:hypothetical protein [candidate division WOR-3 bacterium]
MLTETIDEEGKYRFSWGTAEEWDDEGKHLQDFVPGARLLDHQGTRIWIVDVKRELLEDLLDYRTFMKYISATWWEIIRNRNAMFIVNFDGVDRQVSLPELPRVKKEKPPFINERIGNIGKIRNLVLRYCEDEILVEWRGVSVQRGGMSVLRLPIVAEESLKNKIYGYCNFDDSLETELKKCEFPNHFGFRSKRAWNHTKTYISRKLDEFVQEISPMRKKEITMPSELIARAVQIVNDLVREYAPELASEAIGSGGKNPDTKKPREKKEPSPIRIDTFRGNARKLEYDESLITECELVNDTAAEAKISLRIEIKHEEGDLKFNPKYTIKLDDNARKRIDIPLVDFQEGIDKPGEYSATAVLKDEGGKELHRRSFTFYLHEEPPPSRGKVFLGTLEFSPGRGTPLEKKRQLPVTDKGALRIIWDHPDFVHVRELAGSKKALKHEIFLYAIKCGIDEAVQKLLEFRYNEGQLDTDEIRVIKDKCDAMYYDAVLSPMA